MIRCQSNHVCAITSEVLVRIGSTLLAISKLLSHKKRCAQLIVKPKYSKVVGQGMNPTGFGNRS
jgi:hypothetical protein